MANMRTAKEEKLSAKEEKYKAKLEERERVRLEQEEKLKSEEEEQKKTEAEEFNKWKDLFSVEEKGEDNDLGDDAAVASKLEDFLVYVKRKKVVILEDLAQEFRMKSQDVINQLQKFELEGKITGVFDDRGKFIYVTMEEMERVAKYVEDHGRISVTSLAAASNKLIMLNHSDGEGGEKLIP